MIQSIVSPSPVRPLSLSQHLTYSAPVVAVVFLFGPIAVLQGIYAKYYGMALTTIATVLLISRLFDAVTDPLVGYWSDRYQTRKGTRKPFILAGGLLFIVSGYFLYVPVDPNTIDASTIVSPVYFLVWLLLFYLAFTLFEVPHLAWGAELSPSAEAKNKIYSLRFLSFNLGTLCFYMIPFFPVFASHDFTPQTLQWAAVGACVLMFFAVVVCVLRTPNGLVVTRHRPLKEDTLQVLRSEIMANKPVLLFFIGLILFITGAGMFFTSLYILVDSYLKLGHHYAQVVLIGVLVSILALGFWYWLANRVGKKCVLGLGAFFYGIGACLTGFMDPGQTDLMTLSLVMILVYISAIPAVGPSLLSELIDYSTWKFGVNRSATYFSLLTFVVKTAGAVGGSIALWIAGGYGFDPAATEHTEYAVFGLHLAACWLPTLLMFSSVVVFSLMPMNAHRHRIIRRRLDDRRLRELKHDRFDLKSEKPLQTLEPIVKSLT